MAAGLEGAVGLAIAGGVARAALATAVRLDTSDRGWGGASVQAPPAAGAPLPPARCPPPAGANRDGLSEGSTELQLLQLSLERCATAEAQAPYPTRPAGRGRASARTSMLLLVLVALAQTLPGGCHRREQQAKLAAQEALAVEQARVAAAAAQAGAQRAHDQAQIQALQMQLQGMQQAMQQLQKQLPGTPLQVRRPAGGHACTMRPPPITTGAARRSPTSHVLRRTHWEWASRPSRPPRGSPCSQRPRAPMRRCAGRGASMSLHAACLHVSDRPNWVPVHVCAGRQCGNRPHHWWQRPAPGDQPAVGRQGGARQAPVHG